MSSLLVCSVLPEEIRHTPDHRNCPLCEQDLRSGATGIHGGMCFAEAFRVWIGGWVLDPFPEGGDENSEARFISPRTEQDLRQYGRAAEKFFGRIPLSEIHLGHFRAYQRARRRCDRSVAKWEQRAGANLIRKEVQTVMRVMRDAGLWTEEFSRGLRLVRQAESGVSPAISPAEQARLLKSAARREEWELVYWWALVALQTTASTDELRGLRLEDVTVGEGACIRTRGKNRYRPRSIPVASRKGRWALEMLLARARRLGAKRGSDFLFPLHLGAEKYDATQPMTVSGLRKRWEAVREDAGLPGLRIYALRHAGLTRMAEGGAPVHVMMSYAGHMSMRMQRHYVSISMASKTEWAERIWSCADGDRSLEVGGSDGDTLPPKKGPGVAREAKLVKAS
jgi:integrase